MSLTVVPAVRPRRARAAGTARLAIVAGLLALVGVGGWLLWTRHVGTEQAGRTVAELQEQWRDTPYAPAATEESPVVKESRPTAPVQEATQAPIPGKAFAIMTVPRFGADWQMPVFEGTGTQSLRGGVGHYANTALPGELGNFAVAGHRTTWAHPFREVDRLRTGDEVIVRTREALYTYRVSGHEIVEPGETDVLDPVPGDSEAEPVLAQLTMTTCHPEYSDWQRWVVRAVLVQTETMG